jgi:hypothetical protein
VRTFSFGGIDRADAVLVDPVTGAVTLGGLAGTSPFGFGVVRVDGTGQPMAGFGTSGMVATSMGGSGADEIATLLNAGDGTIIAVGTADGGFPEADLAFARYDGAGIVGSPKIVAGTDRDRASAAVLSGDRIVVGDSTLNASFAQVAQTRAVSATTFDPVAGFGGPPFGTPSNYRGMALTPDGTVLGFGMAPFGGSKDDFQLVSLAADGTPAAPARNYPGTADKQENAGAIVEGPAPPGRQSATGRLILLAGDQDGVPALGAVGQSSGSATGRYDLAVSITDDNGIPPELARDGAGTYQLPVVELSGGAVHPPHAALVWAARVTNNGPDKSPATQMQIDSTIPGSALEPINEFTGTCHNVNSPHAVKPFWLDPPKALRYDAWTYHFDNPTASLNCDVPGLAPGDSTIFRFDLHLTQLKATAGIFDLAVPCGGEAENQICANNVTKAKVQPLATKLQAWAQISKASRGKIRGKALPPSASSSRATIAKRITVRRVQVAIARVNAAPHGVIAAAAKRCAWLKNTKGKTVSRTPILGFCPRPVWITAKGTKRWRLKLRKKLAKGRYEVLARALDSRGRAQSAFPPPSDVRLTVKR